MQVLRNVIVRSTGVGAGIGGRANISVLSGASVVVVRRRKGHYIERGRRQGLALPPQLSGDLRGSQQRGRELGLAVQVPHDLVATIGKTCQVADGVRVRGRGVLALGLLASDIGELVQRGMRVGDHGRSMRLPA